MVGNPTTFLMNIFCWHIHVYFLQNNNASIDAALSIHQDFINRFSVSDVPCEAEVTKNVTCVWGCKERDKKCLNMSPQGPHTFGSVGFSMPNSEYNEIMPWVFQMFNIYGDRIAGMLIHPLTADREKDTLISRRRDHELGIWIPERLPIDYDFLDHNIYDCDVCDVNNCTQVCV